MSIKGPAILREQNQKMVLSLLRRYKQTSRKDLAKLMGVSKNTVSIIVDQFMKDGMIREVGVNDLQKVGRPKILIELNAESFKAIGITISRDGLEYVVIDYYSNIIQKECYKANGRNVIEVVDSVSLIVNSLLEEFDGILGVGIGIPGIVNSVEGIVYESTKLQWKNVMMLDLLKDKIEVPLFIHNNVKMASLCSSDYEDVDTNVSSFYIRIGDGIGGAFIREGVIWDGNSWTSGEIGHISVEPEGPICSCGQKGCLEKMISHTTFMKWKTKFDKESFNLTPEEISGKVNDLMFLYGKYLGFSLISVINIVNPGKIVIDSPYNENQMFKTTIIDFLEQNALKIPFSNTTIHFNNKPYSQSLGAATAVILKNEN